MREIKFRAWANHTKAMIDWDEFLADMATFKFALKHKDTFHVMQFTGLHDKNGKEIYEGDVVKMRGESVFVVRFDEVEARFGLSYAPDKGSVIPINPTKDEVIGNIYENPELLSVA